MGIFLAADLSFYSCPCKINVSTLLRRIEHPNKLCCSCGYNAVYVETLCYTQPTWRLTRVALKSFWVTSLKSLLQGTDLSLTFNRVRIPCITFFSLFASVVGSDTGYSNFSCYLSPFVRFVSRCVQTFTVI